jgi:hypothetical protein
VKREYKRVLDYIKHALAHPHLYEESELEYLRKTKKEMKSQMKYKRIFGE